VVAVEKMDWGALALIGVALLLVILRIRGGG
jgi:hypothetical protein